jgi:hypothetical protein
MILFFLSALTLTAATTHVQNDNITISQASTVLRGKMPQNYVITCSVATTISSGQGNPDESLTELKNISVWSMSGKFRTDIQYISSSLASENVGYRFVSCRNCDRSGFAITTACGSDKSRSTVKYNPINSSYDKTDEWNIDWRGLGLLNHPISKYHVNPWTQQNDYIAKYANTLPALDNVFGKKCTSLTQSKPGTASEADFTVTTSYCPEYSLNPVKHFASSKAHDMDTFTEIRYREIHPGVWFPESLIHTKTTKGKITFSETLTIISADFVSPIDEKVFTLEGLSLDDYQPVAFPEYKDIKDFPVWRNGKIDKNYTTEMMVKDAYNSLQGSQQPTPDTLPFMQRNSWIYYVGSGLLIVLAAVLFRKARRPR